MEAEVTMVRSLLPLDSGEEVLVGEAEVMLPLVYSDFWYRPHSFLDGCCFTKASVIIGQDLSFSTR